MYQSMILDNYTMMWSRLTTRIQKGRQSKNMEQGIPTEAATGGVGTFVHSRSLCTPICKQAYSIWRVDGPHSLGRGADGHSRFEQIHAHQRSICVPSVSD